MKNNVSDFFSHTIGDPFTFYLETLKYWVLGKLIYYRL